MQIRQPIRTIQDFLLSTYFADGIRITIGVLLPSLILAQFGMLKIGLTLSLGALCVSIVDSPGPMFHRRNAMLITTVLITVFSILTGLTNKNHFFIGFVLMASSFVFSMFYIYGLRAASIGTATLLIIVLSIDDIRPWQDVLLYSLFIFIGGIWYTVLSYMVYRIRPYRMVQQSLSESVSEVADFLREKAKFYHRNNNYEKTYADLLQLQVLVHEKQDAVRELLFKTREIIRDSTPEGRFLLLVFIDMVDLFEQVMSTYYNYNQLHEQFDSSGILADYEMAIKRVSYALDDIAFALKSGRKPVISKRLLIEIERLRKRINELEENNIDNKYNTLGIIALKNIEVNIENILSRVKTIHSYFRVRESKEIRHEKIDSEKFITRQKIDFELFTENLTYSSSTFRHSLRVSVVMMVGFIIAQLLTLSHSYWILLTILVISKPGYTLTKQRNYQRLIGTVIGALVGAAVINYITDRNTLFAILLVCMIGCYSFQRKNYVISVLFMTPYILILFDFLGIGTMALAQERIYDTFIGSGIALIGSYLLFPTWEHEKLKSAMVDMLNANKAYYEQVIKLYFEKDYDRTNYKVARKEVYVNTANLASLFQRMFSEPKSKQMFIKEVHQFTALSHLLSSYVASLSLYNRESASNLDNYDGLLPMAKNTIYLLDTSVNNFLTGKAAIENVPLIRLPTNASVVKTGEEMVPEQFDLIQKVAYDIYKLSFVIKI
ncbi:FUSC family protein [Pedobacter changchengzhani]|uniref:FUSC family protein n=1 Tax=Pedobacter changchengzhani TaxID=2529274 RepID=A0A4R5MJF6_9SPHI|nr:FUSC family membrane protein [Pedobacter changchengzhani]TDG35662.1 FUSC family protein [Pedobacter changchengzhani]